MRHKQRLVATSAVWRLAQFGLADAVGGVAMGANNVQKVSHGNSFQIIIN
jgi:hypothetical protein